MRENPVAAHALFVLIHDYTHNVVFKTANANRLGAICANIAIVFPAAIGFRNYHLMHHKYLGIPGLDADVPTPREARWVGNSWWRKTFWLSMRRKYDEGVRWVPEDGPAEAGSAE